MAHPKGDVDGLVFAKFKIGPSSRILTRIASKTPRQRAIGSSAKGRGRSLNGIGGFQWTILPLGNLFQDRVGHCRDQVWRYLKAVNLQQMAPKSKMGMSRVLMPRAYIDKIFSSKPGKRR
jgi:hypothetical protein